MPDAGRAVADRGLAQHRASRTGGIVWGGGGMDHNAREHDIAEGGSGIGFK